MGYLDLPTFFRTIISKVKTSPLPFVLIALFLILTIFGVSGSSLAAIDKQISGTTPGILLGEPRLVRSDEYLWQSQDLLAQKKANYPAFNKNIGQGQDMTMIVDVPFRSFFALFKPQNLFFFILPYTNAFAARWWFMALALCLGFYFLFDSLFPRRRLLVGLGAVLLLFNPFTQWWYQSISLLAIAFGLWACFFVVKIFSDKATTKRLIFYSLGLAYSLLSFILLLYPPFQLPAAYVMIAVVLGFFYYRYRAARTPLKDDKRRLLAVGTALVITGLIFSIFFVTHRQIIHTLTHTVYPGTRDFLSGQSGSSPDGSGFNILSTFSAPTLINLQSTVKAAHFYTNQSEAARMVALNLLLIPIVVFQLLQKPRKNWELADYLLISTSILAAIFVIRMFTPLFNLPFKALLFSKVQNERLSLGVALLCVVQLIILGLTSARTMSLKKAVVVSVIAFGFLFDSSLVMTHRFPGFMSGLGVLAVCALISLCGFLMLQKRTFTIGLSLFLAFNVAASVAVNPLYDRSQPAALQSAAQYIANKYPDHKAWVVFDSATFENIPLVAGKQSYSGVQSYPQLDLWHSLDQSKKAAQIYNRFSHVAFSADSVPGNAEFDSPQSDVLHVRFTCSIAKKLPNFGYVLSPGAIDTSKVSCLKEDGKMTYPNVALYIYKYTP